MSAFLSLRNVSFAYHQSRLLQNRALKNISIEIEIAKGEFFSVVGPNGSGKSTLLKILAGILSPDTGDVFIEGKLLRDFKRRALAKKVAYVPQFFSCDFPFTVLEFVEMGRSPHLSFFGTHSAQDEVEVRKAVHATACETLVRRDMLSLSGGERQRALLAQAIAQGADILLLDEPVSHLDIGHQLQILGMLKEEVCRGKTVIASFHDLNLAAQFSNRILLLSHGTKLACGKPEEVLIPEFIEQTFHVEVRVLNSEELKRSIIVPTGKTQ